MKDEKRLLLDIEIQTPAASPTPTKIRNRTTVELASKEDPADTRLLHPQGVICARGLLVPTDARNLERIYARVYNHTDDPTVYPFPSSDPIPFPAGGTLTALGFFRRIDTLVDGKLATQYRFCFDHTVGEGKIANEISRPRGTGTGFANGLVIWTQWEGDTEPHESARLDITAVSNNETVCQMTNPAPPSPCV